jgi:hypothetical protein
MDERAFESMFLSTWEPVHAYLLRRAPDRASALDALAKGQVDEAGKQGDLTVLRATSRSGPTGRER